MDLQDIEIKETETGENEGEEVVNKYATELPEIKSDKAGKGFAILGAFLLLSALIVLGITVYIGGKNRMKPTSVSNSGNPSVEKTFTWDEVEALVSEASRISGEEASAETEGEYLSKIKEATSLDGGTINLLKHLFPESVVFADGSHYVYVPIDKELKSNSLDRSRFEKDENTGFLTYKDDNGNVTSHIGIDVSRHQGPVDWEKVKAAGVEFVIIKCGIRGYGAEGNFAEDVMFKTHIEGAIAAGLEVGVYFVTQAVTIDEAVEEAEWVLDIISPYAISGPIALDVEYAAADERTKDLTPDERSANIMYFCDTVKEAGFTPIIYSNTKYFIRKMNMSMLEDYGKWYANYNSVTKAENKTIWEYNDPMYFPYQVDMWQYTASGIIDGINTVTDINILFEKWW